MESSDRKSLNNLTEYLEKLREKSGKDSKKDISPTCSKRVSPRRNTITTPSPSARKKRPRNENSHSKITFNEKKLKPLDVSVTKNNTSKKIERSSSFEKYGVRIPSYEKILADHKMFDDHKNRIKAFDAFDDQLLEQKLNTDCLKEPEKFAGELLDCKHLSLDQLSEAFAKHLHTLKLIMNGKHYSERHKIFHNYNFKYNFTFKDLRYSTSLVIFTQKQIDHLLDLMREELDPQDTKTNYFFKVLLPELCLFIFMDIHNMNKRQAKKYLDERPIDI